jgi:hypothetical protein
LRDEHVDLEIAPGVVTSWVRPAIARVIPPPEPADTESGSTAVVDDDTN